MDYNAQSIKQLSFREGVRQRPGLYLRELLHIPQTAFFQELCLYYTPYW